MLLKHDMVLDYILAKQSGLCVALNLTGGACYSLIPDSSDNITSVIDALRHIRNAFESSEGAGCLQMLGCRINWDQWEQYCFRFR